MLIPEGLYHVLHCELVTSGTVATIRLKGTSPFSKNISMVTATAYHYRYLAIVAGSAKNAKLFILKFFTSVVHIMTAETTYTFTEVRLTIRKLHSILIKKF